MAVIKYKNQDGSWEPVYDTSTTPTVTKMFHTGTTAPTNINLLWIDTNPTTGGLKYYNGTSWVVVPVSYS